MIEMNIAAVLITFLHDNTAEIGKGTVFKKEFVVMPSRTLIGERYGASVIPEVGIIPIPEVTIANATPLFLVNHLVTIDVVTT